MKLFEKIKVNLHTGKMRVVYFLGIELLSYTYNSKGKMNICFRFFNNNHKVDKLKRMFYLKINRNIDDSVICFQHWINIINNMGADYVIVCDDNNLKKKILNSVIFYNSNIKFIKSIKYPFLKIVKKQNFDKNWYNAAFAHLTCFWHAKKNDLMNFWNIDADDSLILMSANRVAEMLNMAEKYTEINELDALGLDFWAIQTKGKHWSFGITYTRMNKDYFNLINTKLISWKKYENFTSVHNLDWLFTYLKDENCLNLKTFYIENLYLVHFGRFIGDIGTAWVSTWRNGEVIRLILSVVFKSRRGIFKIQDWDDIIKLNFLISENECLDFAMDYLIKRKWVF